MQTYKFECPNCHKYAFMKDNIEARCKPCDKRMIKLYAIK